MLESSPKLQVLKLINKWLCEKNCLVAYKKWNREKNVYARCSISRHLCGMATKST
ncbi:unnamed protein product [Brassica oleracea]